MSGGDLDSAGSKLHVDENIVGDDDLAVRKVGVDELLAVQVSVPGIFGVHCDSNVAEHGFKTVVATTTSSSDPLTLYAKDVSVPNSYFLSGSCPGTARIVRPGISQWSTSMSEIRVER